MHGWKEYPIIMKIVIVFFVTEWGLFVLSDTIWTLTWPKTYDLQSYLWSINVWYTNLDYFGILNVPSYRYLYELIPFVLILYNYLNPRIFASDMENQTREIRVARIVWITFAIINMIFIIYINELPGAGETYFLNKQLMSVLRFTGTLLLLILLVLIPETFLISNIQLNQAKKLYSFIRPGVEIHGPSFTLDYKERIAKYIQRQSDAIKVELNI
jgi:hypothetical protein